jgi:pimeloyl-ACP methyl ester carboxylesterase
MPPASRVSGRSGLFRSLQHERPRGGRLHAGRWPHDSLAPIDTSAIRLAALLDAEFKATPPAHVVFVCHSQGGLLARDAALPLKRMKSPAQWENRIAGIVTFGTPHDGAAIAEPGFKSGREAAVYLMMLN